MTDRKSISKKDRFEVFKRDSFTCQYCGRSAPDVILQVDHIQPVSKDGDNDITNLITSCFDCNSGKSDRELSDDTVLQKRKKQLDELQERREQLDMMVEWQRGMADLDGETAERCAAFWTELVTGYYLNENGMIQLRKTIRRYGIVEVLEAMRISTDQYLKLEQSEDGIERPTSESVEKAWEYVSRICNSRRQQKERPYLRDLYYIRGILRRRFNYMNEWDALDILERAYLINEDVELLKEIAIEAKNWSEWKCVMQPLIGGKTNG